MLAKIEQLAPRYVSPAGFSVRLDRISIASTRQTIMQLGPWARLQFGLARRTPPLRAELPDNSWRSVGRVLFATPHCAMKVLVPGGVYESMEVSYPEAMLREVGLFRGEGDAPLPVGLSPNNRHIESDLARLAQELRAPRIGHASYVDAIGMLILHEIAHVLSHQAEQLAGHSGGLAQRRRRIIAERLASEADPIPHIAELAALCGLSSRHLMRAFRQETGETLGVAIRRSALERARQWLAADDRSIGQIARDLGFSSSATFGVAFRRAFGMLPSECRSRRCAPGMQNAAHLA